MIRLGGEGGGLVLVGCRSCVGLRRDAGDAEQEEWVWF